MLTLEPELIRMVGGWVQTTAVICQDYCHLPSHWNADKTLSQW